MSTGTGDLSARFQADAGSIADARRFVAGAIERSHPALSEAVTLAVSELATNAVRYGGTDYSVAVQEVPTGVRVAVSDRGGGRAAPKDPAPSDPRGRGLKIVGAIADAWGIEPARVPPGKTIWFEVRTPGPPARAPARWRSTAPPSPGPCPIGG